MKEKRQNQTSIVMKTTIPGADLRKIREEEEKKEEKNRLKKEKKIIIIIKNSKSSAPPLQIKPNEATALEMDWTTWMAMYLGLKTLQIRKIREKESS